MLPREAASAARRRGAAHLLRLRLTAVRGLLALAGGLALYAGHPPVGQGWLGLVALAPLVLLARSCAGAPRPLRVAAGWGWLAGVAFFGPLLYWIGRFGVVPLVLLVAIQAAFVAAYVAGVTGVAGRRWAPAAAVVWWVALEVVRSSWPFGGFPWGQLGLTQHGGGPLLPLARTLGVYGVSLACAAVGVAVAEALRAADRLRRAGGALREPEALFASWRAAIGVVLGVLVAGVLLGGDPPPADAARTLDAAGVQGNDEELPALVDLDATVRIERIAERMLATTAALADDPPEVVVWPENSLDDDPATNPELAAVVDQAIATVGGAPLVAGVLLDGPLEQSFVNAVVLYGPGAEERDVYVKRKLVPFGEYVPLRSLLGWYPALRSHVRSDAVAGTGPEVFDVADATLGPVTCYESVFPGPVRDQVRAGADVLVVSVNNASYGRTAASAQHLAFSRMRAVETGRWILHVGISGISAVVDPQGRTFQETELFEQAIVRAELPLITGRTPFVRLGDLVGRGSLLVAVLGLLVLAVGRARQRVRGPRGTEEGPAALGPPVAEVGRGG